MRCVSRGMIIEGDPIWVEGEVYCCDECAEIGPLINDHIEEYEEYEEE